MKIRKEDLTELAFSLNWHVLRVQGYVEARREEIEEVEKGKKGVVIDTN